jgi:Tol biopolymer transport system component
LKRTDLGGGRPQTLAEVTNTGAEGTWRAEGVILFNGGAYAPIFRVPASGGQAIAATKLSKGQAGLPRFLPGGRQFLCISNGTDPSLWLGSLDGEGAGAEPRRIAAIASGGDSEGEFFAPGWLVRVRGNDLVAQRFDAGRGQLSGEPVTLAQAVGADPINSAGAFSAASGVIAWRNGGGGRRQLIWFNRSGQNAGTFGAPNDSGLFNPELSPDGKRAVITRGPVGSADLWMQEGTRISRFTFDPADDRYAIWSPDGARVVFASNRKGTFDLYEKPANGSGSDEILLQSADTKRPNSWSPDGRFVLYWSSQNNGDLMVLPVAKTEKPGDRKPYPFLSTPFNEQDGAFSPDGMVWREAHKRL